MAAAKFVGIGLFILFTLPALVAASDRRHAHDLFHALLALAGLAWACFAGGWHAALLALASGALIVLLFASAVAITQRRWQRRPLTGGDIKFTTAAAIWLMPWQAFIALLGASCAFILWAFINKSISAHVSRPDIGPFIVVAVLSTMVFWR